MISRKSKRKDANEQAIEVLQVADEVVEAAQQAATFDMPANPQPAIDEENGDLSPEMLEILVNGNDESVAEAIKAMSSKEQEQDKDLPKKQPITVKEPASIFSTSEQNVSQSQQAEQNLGAENPSPLNAASAAAENPAPKKRATKKTAPTEAPVQEVAPQAIQNLRFIEYLSKNTLYLLPPRSVIYGESPIGYVEIDGRKTKNITSYIYSGATSRDNHTRVGLPVTGLGSSILEEYKDITEYVERKSQISFLELEHTTGTKIALCTFFKPADAAKADAFLKQISASLPFLVNIFRRPLIHLKQAEIIQPIDAVKRVNHLTVRHLSRHPEHWKDIDKNNNIVPARLLTRVYEDDYNIYENVVFRELIDRITTFLQKRAYSLTQILETFTDSIKLDAVNMFNHRNYYLAIGKLYVGFYGMDDSSGIKYSLDNCRYLYKEINNYKNRAVYVKNAKLKAGAGEVKRTNILTMHKDYRHVLLLSQDFSKQSAHGKEVGSYERQIQSQKAFTHFCFMLAVFSASNFNLECVSEGAIIINGKLDAQFKYKDWELRLHSEYNEILDFEIIMAKMSCKGESMSMAFIPMSYYLSQESKKRYEHICRMLYHGGTDCDKYVFLEPFENDDSLNNYLMSVSAGDRTLRYAVLPISVTELNSFRRLQKLYLEMMVLTNNANDICPFCGARLNKERNGDHTCNKCKMVIKKVNCASCSKQFTATYVNAKNTQKEDIFKDLPDLLRQEKLYHFRNIVNMHKNRLICPYCGMENNK